MIPFSLRYSSYFMGSILALSFGLFLAFFTWYDIPEWEKERGNGEATNFLLSVVGMVMAIGITNLVKGYDVLIKHWPEEMKFSSRWSLRALWGVNLLSLTIQLVWGMRLALGETANFWFFLYYGFLASLVYAMVVYIFPENIESVFIKEKGNSKKSSSKLYWSPSIVSRLCKLYFFLGIYMAATIPMSFIFWYNCPEHHASKIGFLSIDGGYSLVGSILKLICFFIIWKGLSIKKKNWNKIVEEHDTEKNKKPREDKPNKVKVIVWIDFVIIISSILVSFFYMYLRWTSCPE